MKRNRHLKYHDEEWNSPATNNKIKKKRLRDG